MHQVLFWLGCAVTGCDTIFLFISGETKRDWLVLPFALFVGSAVAKYIGH